MTATLAQKQLKKAIADFMKSKHNQAKNNLEENINRFLSENKDIDLDPLKVAEIFHEIKNRPGTPLRILTVRYP